MGKKLPPGIPQRKKKGGSRTLKIFLLLVLGAMAGWYFAPPDKQKQLKLIFQQSSKDFPGALSKLQNELPSATVVKSVLANIPLHIGRFYDDNVPQDFRDSLASGLPALFSYPYLCKVARVYRTGDTDLNKQLGVSVRVGNMESELRMDGIVRPGVTLLATGPLNVDVECHNVRMSFERGTQVQFLRGDGSRKMLEVRGPAMIRTSGESNIGFVFPGGETAVNLGPAPTQLQYRIPNSIARAEILSGVAEFRWKAANASESSQELFEVAANPAAKVTITEINSEGEISHDIGPKRLVAFMSNGRLSGAPTGVRANNGNANASANMNRNAAHSNPTVREPPPGLALAQSLLTVSTENKANVDVLLEWQLNPGARIVPCEIELAADEGISKVLAKYKSNEMRLMLKGMSPGLYYWRVNCSVDGSTQSTTAGKIAVTSGRKGGPVPVLLLPPNNQRLTEPAVVFQWEKVEGARAYVLQLSLDAKFKKFNEYSPKNLESAGLKMNLKVHGKYFWRVYAVIGATKADRSGYSSTRSFSF